MNDVNPGFAIVDKPVGMTSHDVVGRMRRLARTRKVGHGGTLDPAATGVLVIAIGKVTRLLNYVSGCDKSYDATIRLGVSTVTDDAEGEVRTTHDTGAVVDTAIHAGLAAMEGDIDQVPSTVSAVKVEGKRAYQRVREGEEVALPARPVTIRRMAVHRVRRTEHLEVDISVDCSSGTYIRAIARDLGDALGVGGHLVTLRRTRVGDFGISEALSLEELAEKDSVVTHSAAQAMARIMPSRTVAAEQARVVGHGGKLSPMGQPGPYAVLDPSGAVVAVMEEDGRAARPRVVLAGN